MKKKISSVIIFVFILVLSGTPAQAATTSNINELVSQMESYEYALLRDLKTKKSIKLTKAEMAKASALSIEVNDKDGIAKSEELHNYDTFKITDEQISKASLNLFGIKLTGTSLNKKGTKWNLSDSYRLEDGTPVVYHFDGETELDFKKIGLSLKKLSDGSYNVVKSVYYGYWGYNTGEPNYSISYQVKKNKKSAYGYVITSMTVAPIKN